MKGTGPSPTAKKATKNITMMAERICVSKRMESARIRELVPCPTIEIRRHVFRPSLSGSGEHASVVIRLIAEMMMVSSAELTGRRSRSRETEYMIMELMPHSCCEAMAPTQAITAGR